MEQSFEEFEKTIISVKETKKVDKFELRLLSYQGEVVGMDMLQDNLCVNETFTAKGCEVLTEARLMRTFELELCPSKEEIQKLYDENSIDW